MSRQYEVYVNKLREEMEEVKQQQMMLLQLAQQQTAGIHALVSRIEQLEDGDEPTQPAHANGKAKTSRKADR